MEYLTESLGVVKQNVKPIPIPGYTVVVFKEKRGLKKFHDILNEEDRLIKKPLFSKETYISFAVNTDSNLILNQSTEVTLPEQQKHFTLACRVYFHVSEPKLVVIRFTDDPIKRIWDEIKSQLSTNVKKSDIKLEDIKSRFKEVEKKIILRESLESLKIFSGTYGIEIEKIVLNYILPEGELEVDTERDKYKKEIVMGKLKKERLISQRDEEIDAKLHELEIKKMENDTETRKQISEQFVVAVKQLAEQITNPENFKKSAIVFKEVLTEFFTNPHQSGNSNGIMAIDSIKKVLSVGEESLFEDLRKVLLDIITDISGMENNTVVKKQILSITTRLLSETYREKEADVVTIEKYIEHLGGFTLKQRAIFTRDRMERIKEFKAKLNEIKSQSCIE